MREPLECVNHPGVSTFLRCSRCGKPICTRCAIQTPVGYRCRECVRGVRSQSALVAAPIWRQMLVVVVALTVSGVAGYLLTALRGWLYTLLLGPLTGLAIGELAWWIAGQQRTRRLALLAAGGALIGALLWMGVRTLDLALSIWSLELTNVTLASLSRAGLGGLIHGLVYLVAGVAVTYVWVRRVRQS